MQKNNLAFNLLFGFFFLITSLVVYSQQTSIDSLDRISQKKKLANNLIKKGKFISASIKLKEAFNLIPSKNNEKKMIMLYNIGRAYSKSRDSDSARYFYDKAEYFYHDSLSPYIKSIRYFKKASLFYGSLQIDSTIHYALMSLDYALLTNNKKLIYENTVSLGEIFLSQNNLEKALSYFDKATVLAEKIDNKLLGSNLLTCKGRLELERKNYDIAETYLKEALQEYEKEEDYVGILLAKGHLSKLYMRTGQPDKAVKLSFELLPMISEFEFRFDTKKMISNTNSMVSLLKKSKQSQKVIEKAKTLVEDNIRVSKELQVKSETNKAFITYYKNYQKAIDIETINRENKNTIENKIQETLMIQDSLYTASLEAKYTELEVKYQTQKKEKKNIQLNQLNIQQKLDLEIENKRKWLFGLSLIVALTTLGVFLFFYRKNRKQKIIIEKLQRELHHRIKNNLAIIDTFIDNTKDELQDISGKQKLSELQNRINSIYKVHELLYNSNKNITKLSAQIYVETLVTGVQSSFLDKEVAIITDIDTNTTLSAEKTFPVGLIINEFLTNSYKHAFDNAKNPQISISISEQKDLYSLELSDNGKGLPKNFNSEELDTFGMDVFKLLCEQLNGSLILNGNNGVSLYITFPKT